eukprot:4380095-Amphidinium_carterae.1
MDASSRKPKCRQHAARCVGRGFLRPIVVVWYRRLLRHTHLQHQTGGLLFSTDVEIFHASASKEQHDEIEPLGHIKVITRNCVAMVTHSLVSSSSSSSSTDFPTIWASIFNLVDRNIKQKDCNMIDEIGKFSINMFKYACAIIVGLRIRASSLTSKEFNDHIREIK